MEPSYQTVVKVTLSECVRTGKLITFLGCMEHTEGPALLRVHSLRQSAGYSGVSMKLYKPNYCRSSLVLE